MRLAGKTAIVTGAASGIGRAVAESFAREGCRVLVTDVDAERGPRVVEAIIAAGGEASFHVLDVTVRDAVRDLISETAKTYGRLDIMVNNAGVPAQGWQRTIDVNLTGVFHGIRYAARSMAEAGGGSIISTASVGGLIGLAAPIDSGTDAYVAAKHGVVGLTREFALEYGPYNVRVNCVCPGATETDLTARFLKDDGWRQRMEAKAALKRLAKPEEIAAAFLFLASDEASYVTGAAIAVDGGQTAGH